jgi:hypothetical protein
MKNTIKALIVVFVYLFSRKAALKVLNSLSDLNLNSWDELPGYPYFLKQHPNFPWKF